MMDYKTILGFIAASLQLVSYFIYFQGIYKGKTKPHAFTWTVWGIINIVGFAAILIAGGGPGAWTFAVNLVLCFAVATVGYIQKRVTYDSYDWIALSGGILGAVIWGITKNPLGAIILIAISDAIGFIPTFRKAYHLPFDENAISFGIGVINYLIALLALKTLTITTWLYPAEISVVDGLLVVLIIYRRKQVNKLKTAV